MIQNKPRPLFAVLLVVVVLASAVLACRRTPEPEPNMIVEQEQAPALPDPTEPVETAPEPIVVEDDQPEPEPEGTVPGQQGAVISSEEIIRIAPGEEPGIYQPGDVIAIKDQIIMVLGWEILPEDEYFKPDPDYVYTTIDLIIVNTNTTPILVSSLLQTSLTAVTDGVKENYPFNIMATAIAKGGIIDGELMPGERIRGKAGYQLPETASDLQFTYELEFLAPDKVSFDLGSEPVLIQPPAFIPGETLQAAYALGEIIEINDLTLQVTKAYVQPGQQMLMPSEGYQFIIIELSITNNAPELMAIPWNDIGIRDSTGLNYRLDTSAIALVGGSLPTDDYAQGETVTFVLGYEVPEEETEFLLLVDARDWDAEVIRIALSLE